MKLDKHLITSVIMFRKYNHIEIIEDIETEFKDQQFIQRALKENPKEILSLYKYKRSVMRSFLN